MGANLKEVRERIKSVSSTQQITKAMKMVSAAKLKRAQDAITFMRPYADKLNEMMQNILDSLDGEASTTYGIQREAKKIGIVLITSNRGLCGSFNSNLIKKAIQLLTEEFPAQLEAGDITLYPIGKKGFDYFKKRKKQFPLTIETDFVNLFDDLSFDHVVQVPDLMMEKFSSQELDHIEIVYNYFQNAAVQVPKAFQFLPVPKVESITAPGDKIIRADYIFEPDKQELLENLIPSILQTQFQKCVLDTNASEQGARMTAMEQATENAGDLIRDLKIEYNKARQEAITKEISEIVGGAAALGG